MKTQCTEIINSVVCLVLLCFLLALPLHAVTFSTNAWIGAGDFMYDGQAITVDGSTLTIDGVHVFDEIHVINNGVITHSTGVDSFALTVSNLFSVDATSRVDAHARGMLAIAGTTQRSGGSYGGRGGQWSGTSCATYGDAFLPRDLGSGGAGGPRGGGRIDITADNLQLDGVIRVNGQNGVSYAGGGSGGSILLRVGTLSGAGMLQANGGTRAADGSGGGGGRIAVYYATLAGFDLSRMECAGGPHNSNPNHAGGAGTIYVRQTSAPYGTLVLDNRGGIHVAATPSPYTLDTNVIDRLHVRGQARLDMTLNDALYLNETVVSGAYVTMTGDVYGPDLVLDNGSWTHGGTFGFSNTISLTDHSVLSHATGDTNGLRIVAQDMMIDATSRVDAHARGMLAIAGTTLRSGGSYGGRGGQWSGTSCATYGDAFLPRDLGSGGAGGPRGGGRIDITADTLQLDGVISVNGQNGVAYTGGGSGGSIFLKVGTLSGAGLLQANGGTRAADGSGGGGGRIAVYYETLAGFDLSRMECGGGPHNSNPNHAGGAGTIYVRQTSAPYGTLVLDNRGGIHAAAAPSLYTLDTNVIDRLHVRGQARLDMTLNDALYLNETVVSGAYVTMTGDVYGPDLVLDNGSWTHGGTFGFSNTISLTDHSVLSHATGDTNGLRIVAQDMMIDATSRVDAHARGTLAIAGTTLRSGGSYGGRGGQWSGTSCATYGDAFLPRDLGSGGAGGPRGGGRIDITADNLQLDGVISVNGQNGVAYTGGGSGGSIFLKVGTLSGAGMLQANGGTRAADGSGGGGGRIAVYYATLAGFDLSRMECAGGPHNSNPNHAGGAGTIYMRQTSAPYGTLVLDNRGGIHVAATPSPYTLDTNVIDRLHVRGQARLDMTLNDALYLNETVVSGAYVTMTGDVYGPDLILDNGSWTHGGTFGFSNTISLTDHSVLSHATGDTNGLRIVAQDMMIDATSRVDAHARGMLAIAGTTLRSGGSYGGRGGQWSGTSCATYGDAFLPRDLGSGGAGGRRGGGRIDITADTLQLDGVIRVNGENGVAYTGGGSGGSIFLKVGTLSGAGMLQANGGTRAADGSGGGGGRIAVYYETLAGFDLSRMECAGGPHNSYPNHAGGAGTIYVRQTSAPYGTLVLDNRGGWHAAATPSPYTLNTNVIDRLHVRGQARLDITLSNTLYLSETVVSEAYVTMTGDVYGPDIFLDNGSWTHGGAFGYTNEIHLVGASLLTHITGWSNGLSVTAHAVRIDTNAAIDVTMCGNGVRPDTTGRSGGSHGGHGSDSIGTTGPLYGDVFYPVALGSGGAGGTVRGGGRLYIQAEEIYLDGALKANGQNGPAYNGGGSGGSILLETVALTGNGMIHANGGARGADAGAGGGGRVAVYYIEMDTPHSNVLAAAGANHPQPENGAGTVVIHGPRERFVVSTNSPYAGNERHHFAMRSGAPAPIGVRVQCLASAPDGVNAFAPPTTNRWNDIVDDGSNAYGYFVPPDCMEDSVRMTWMGDELTLTNASDRGQAGFVAGSIGFTISNRTSIGWLRAFSHETITGAVYFADTRGPDTTLDWPGQINYAWDPAALVLSNINPAYVISYTVNPHADMDTIQGTVACAHGGDDNLLPSEAVLVEYRLEGESVWKILDDTLGASGEFSGQTSALFYPTNAYVRAQVKEGLSARPGLPASFEIYVTDIVPEPGGIIYLLLSIMLFIRVRTRCEI